MLVFSLSFSTGTTSVAATVETENWVDGELILSIDNSHTVSIQGLDQAEMELAAVLDDNQFTIKDNLLESTGIVDDQMQIFSENSLAADVIDTMGYTYLIKYPENKMTFEEAKVQLLKKLELEGYQVKSIEPNYILEAIGTVAIDEYEEQEVIEIQGINANQQWHYDMINLPSAWKITTGSSNVDVAVLDTGIDFTHPNLANYVDTGRGKNFSGGSATDFMDRQGHGTHVSGTVASYGHVSGVMQTATLVPVKVLGDNGKGSMYGIEQGVLYAANQNVDVINLSLGGGPYASSFDSACKSAVASGTIVVAATGNEYKSTISYPAAYDSVIAVGAVDKNRVRGDFSNYGAGIDVMAPGVAIFSTYPGERYAQMSGTSMACPHVSGVVGLLRSFNPSITASQACDLLKQTAQSAGSSLEYGSGIVDAYKALSTISGTTPILKVVAPSFSIPSGTYQGAQTVSINSATAGATIRYTTDGQEPTETSSVYNGALRIEQTTTIKAKAFKSGMEASDVAVATYTIETSTQNPTVKEWAVGTAYKNGDIISYNGKKYICRQGHTSVAGWTPDAVPALWSAYQG